MNALRAAAWACLLLACGCASQVRGPRVSPAATPEAAGLVPIRSLVPDIDLDMRYAGAHNFTGAPVEGYDAPRCFLLRPAAEALARVERALREHDMRLRLYDCYRPVRAVQRFVQWAHAPEDGTTKAEFYPAFDKPSLLGDYIAPTSGHSRGAHALPCASHCNRSTSSVAPRLWPEVGAI